MTTPQKIETATVLAESLHAELQMFAIDTLEPTQKTAYQELANSAAFIAQRLKQRNEQLKEWQAQKTLSKN